MSILKTIKLNLGTGHKYFITVKLQSDEYNCLFDVNSICESYDIDNPYEFEEEVVLIAEEVGNIYKSKIIEHGVLNKKEKLIKENYNSTYKEIEFLCYNNQTNSSTTKENQIKLYQALKQLERENNNILPYMQDFSEGSEEQISLAVILLKNDRNLEHKILQLAKKNSVEVDLYNTVDDKFINSIIRKDLEYLIDNENKPDRFGFYYKDLDLFKQYCKETSHKIEEPGKLPEMNNITDYATWVIKKYRKDVGEDEFKRQAEDIFESKDEYLKLIHTTTPEIAEKIKIEGFKPLNFIEYRYYSKMGRNGVYFYENLRQVQFYAQFLRGRTKIEKVALIYIKAPLDIINKTDNMEDGLFISNKDLNQVKIIKIEYKKPDEIY